MAGSSGLIGNALVSRLEADGHRVTRLLRGQAKGGGDVRVWDPDTSFLDPGVFDRTDAVVHLGGASIASLWTGRRKEVIRNSRVRSTRLIAERLADLSKRPAVFVHASATGYYGDRGNEILTEESSPGTGYIANLCRDWEAASMPAQDAGVRVVRLRTAPVLTRRGGTLRVLLPVFQIGLGGRLHLGRQWMPWITLEDIVEIYVRAIGDDSLRGSVNAVAPEPVTNAQFTRELGRALKRPTFFDVPDFLLRLLPGKMADEALLASERVVPEVLEGLGHQFRAPTLADALDRVLRD
jgi:uncharacterized protein (TIGR01777 family)